MDWDKMLKVARIPMIVLLILQMLSFVTLAHQSSYYSYLFLPVILLSYILPAFIYLYTGYSAVKNCNLKLGEAALTGALMSAALTITSTIVAIGAYYSAAVDLASSSIIILAFSIFGLITGTIFNGFLAIIGGLISQWLTKKIEVKRNHLLIAGGVLLVILISLVIIFFIIFYFDTIPNYRASTLQCTFPAGFTCVTNVLYTNGSLYLWVGQGTGHTIRVRGVTCTQNTSPDFTTNGNVLWANLYNITMPSGSQAKLADPTNSNISITCSDASGKPMTDQTIGAIYTGRIYINYTETDTGLTRIVVGTYNTKYEP